MEEFIFDLLHKPQKDYQKAMKNLQHNGVTDENWAFAYLKDSGYWSFKRYGGGGGGANAQAAAGPTLNIPVPPVVAHPVQQVVQPQAPIPPPQPQTPVKQQVIASGPSPQKHIFTTDQLGHTIAAAHTTGAVAGFEIGKQKAKAAADQKLIKSKGNVTYEYEYQGAKDIEKGQDALLKLISDKFTGRDLLLELPAYKNLQLEFVNIDEFVGKPLSTQKSALSRLKKSNEIVLYQLIENYDGKGLQHHKRVGLIKKL